MTRLASIAPVLAAIAGFASTAHAQSQADIAAQSNEAGKKLMYESRYAEASEKFQDAVGRVPEPKYFFNLCTSRFQEGKFGEALTACNAVDKHNPTAEQKAKTEKLIGRIQEEATKQGIDLNASSTPAAPDVCATNPSDPSCQQPAPSVCQTNPSDPSCSGQSPAIVGRPPAELFKGSSPDNKYTWTLGAEVYGGGGRVGRKRQYGNVNTGLRLKGDYLMNAAARVGAQFYLQVTHFQSGKDAAFLANDLDIFDVGLAVYKHICLAGTQRLCITPLAGAHIALMSPAGEEDSAGSQVFNYAAAGARAELAAQYAFGHRFQHVLAIVGGANVYSPVFADPSEGLTRMEVGLDRGGVAGYVGAGYTYRFNTPLGSSPFVTLE
ncbi:MAG: hypothetical protein AB7O24_09265 [Kofleriaceae bacterium]